MKKNTLAGTGVLILLLLLAGTVACSEAPVLAVDAGAVEVHFSGERALDIETEFVTTFPNRDSGQPNNRLAGDWLAQQFGGLGLSCAFDEWQVINHSRPLPLRNVICELPGASERQIVLMAHLDQSPKTVYGADNDGSGIAIMLQLAEIFAAEAERPYSLIFVASDGEEWGALGSQRFIGTHPDKERIIAAITLDNLGKKYYNGVTMDPTGQDRSVGDLWLQLLSRESAETAGGLWIPQLYSPLDQIISQAVPVAKMDQGPLVAAGVPAFGYAEICPTEATELCWESFHSPEDTVDRQSAEALYHAGGNTEVLIRQLFARENFPQESGPYVYLEGSGRVIRGAPLWATFVIFVALFFVAAGRLALQGSGKPGRWRAAIVHFLALWLPMIAAILILYLFVEVGLMDKWDTWPSTSKGDPIYTPRWPAVILWLISLSLLLWAGRRIASGFLGAQTSVDKRSEKGLAMFVVGLGGLYVLLSNAFSLFLMVPMLAWLLIGLRRGLGRALDIVLFLLGGILIIYMFYVFGFGFLRNDFAILWYVMMMFSIKMVSFKSMVAITAMFAAGLTLLVNPPRALEHRERAAPVSPERV